MSDPTRYRDSTQIVLPIAVLDAHVDELEDRFTITVHERGETAYILGSPLVIKEVNEFLCRQGVTLP